MATPSVGELPPVRVTAKPATRPSKTERTSRLAAPEILNSSALTVVIAVAISECSSEPVTYNHYLIQHLIVF